MRQSRSFNIVLVASILCILAACTTTGNAEVTHSLGYRIWLASWESFGADLESSQLHMLYYSARLDEWSVLFLGGYGSGWQGDATRIDAQLSLAYSGLFGLSGLRVGAGAHYITIGFENISGFGGINYGFGEGTSVFYGPEISASYYQAIGESGLGIYGTATVLPYVFWSYDEEQYNADDNEGSTLGFSLDVGASYSRAPWSAQAGYRHFNLQADKGDSEFARSAVDETFSGIYAQAGAAF